MSERGVINPGLDPANYARNDAEDGRVCSTVCIPATVAARSFMALLRIEDQNAQIIDLLTEIRDQGRAVKPGRKSKAEESAEVV